MGQILHGSAKTTHAVRAAIQRSKATLKELAEQYGLNQKTVAKWKKRAFVHDAAMGPKHARSTVLTAEQEAIAVAFRKHTLLPLDEIRPSRSRVFSMAVAASAALLGSPAGSPQYR